MLTCFENLDSKKAIPISIVLPDQFESWLKKQNQLIKNWLTATQFKPEPGSVRLIPNKIGEIDQVVCCISQTKNFWDVGSLPFILPEGNYLFSSDSQDYPLFAIAWGLGAYQFTRYKTPKRLPAKLVLPQSMDTKYIHNMVESIYLVRDLINTPTDDMGPTELAAVATAYAKKNRAKIKHIVGEQLLKQHFPSIYTVGRASDDPPRLIDFRWGNPKHRRVTLIGKGVCFDTGGLDLKPSSAMLLMKKDMAGGAHVLGLANMIMQAKLPIYLRVLIPAVENAISGNAYRPGDIIKSRKGTTIEIGNTDAEGRVILADTLTEAVSENPDLLIDITTLTGAARVALGSELPAVFSNNESLMKQLLEHAKKVKDPIWQLPLFELYRDSIMTPFADINNASTDAYGGAITAALFLREFVPDTIPWLHFDLMAWNLKPRPGRPQGGEAMALRAIFNYLHEKFN